MKLWRRYKSLFFYLVFGGLTTLVNIAAYHLCYEVWGVPNVPANLIAWAASVSVAYVTNKLWVFESKSFAPAVALPELWKFVGCRAATEVADLAVMWVGVDLCEGPALPIKIGANVLVVALNYVLSKCLVFQKNGGTAFGLDRDGGFDDNGRRDRHLRPPGRERL